MKTRYRLISRGSRGGKFYCVDTKTGKRSSLQTSNDDEANQSLPRKIRPTVSPCLISTLQRRISLAQTAALRFARGKTLYPRTRGYSARACS
ncbi:MAG: hypothetical protein ACREFE_18720 [Limisphaerales bacterium]